jgi:hypothetical protein
VVDWPKKIHTHLPGKAGKNLVRPDPVSIAGRTQTRRSSSVRSR